MSERVRLEAENLRLRRLVRHLSDGLKYISDTDMAPGWARHHARITLNGHYAEIDKRVFQLRPRRPDGPT